MSIEIEVGLENASKVKPPTTEELRLDQPQPKGLANPKTRLFLLGGGLVVLAVVVSLAVVYAPTAKKAT